MDKKQKHNQAAKIARLLSKHIAAFGYQRTKTSFWTRINGPAVQFIHLHLFTFAPEYRVHLGVRVLNDDFVAAALNGLSSFDGWYEGDRRYSFQFDTSDGSVKQCAEDLAAFCSEVAEPWFGQFSEAAALLTHPQSPLGLHEKDMLRLAIDGKAIGENVRRSRELLGIA